jgi:hypothetical protein
VQRKWFWAGLSIVSIWLAVLFVGVYGPTLVVDDQLGDHVSVPLSAIVVGFFAFIATIVVARFGFADRAPSIPEQLAEERRRVEALESAVSRLGSPPPAPA